MSKGSSKSTTVQKADPWGPIQPYLLDAAQRAQLLGQDSLPYYPGQTFAGFTPNQLAGMGGMLDYSKNVIQPGVRDYQGMLSQYMGAPLNITNDPAVQNMMAANASNVTDTLTRDWLPSIQGGAIQAGQLGSSRQGVAEGLAMGEASKALANANAQTALGAYGDAVRLAGVGSGLMPGAFQLGMTPYQTQMDLGAMNQAMNQQGINDAMARYYYPEQSAWDTLNKELGVYQGFGNFGSQSTTAPGSSNAANALGGAMLGGSMLGSGISNLGFNMIGASAPAWMNTLGFGLSAPGVGTALGSVLGMLPFIGSDRRIKKNIVPMGEKNGYQWYEFEYKDPDKYGHGKFIGVMADEVEKINPAAVTEIDGYKAVNYGML